jgi:hypothetical protein
LSIVNRWCVVSGCRHIFNDRPRNIDDLWGIITWGIITLVIMSLVIIPMMPAMIGKSAERQNPT